MLTCYIQGAMRRARYEILQDRSFYGEIAGFDGVYADADTLEACREELEEWILLRVSKHLSLPVGHHSCFLPVPTVTMGDAPKTR